MTILKMDVAIDMIEDAIDCLASKRLKSTSNKVPAKSESRDTVDQVTIDLKPKRKPSKKMHSAGVLIRKNIPKKKRDRKGGDTQEILTLPTDKRCSKKFDEEKTRLSKSEDRKREKCLVKQVNKSRGNIPGYARPTLSNRMKTWNNHKKHHPTLTLNKLPYVNCGNQGVTHNIGTIIQQELGNLKLNPLQKQYGGLQKERDSPSVEDVRKALSNVHAEIRVLKKKI